MVLMGAFLVFCGFYFNQDPLLLCGVPPLMLLAYFSINCLRYAFNKNG